MKITFRHPHAKVPQGLKRTAEEKVSKLTRFLDMERAEIVFGAEKNPRISASQTCEVTMQGHGHIVRARASAPDQLSALDKVVDKLEHQLTKLHGKLVGRSHPRHRNSRVAQGSPRLAQSKEPRSRSKISKSPAKTPSRTVPAPVPAPEEVEAAGEPQIVKTKAIPLPSLAPTDAVLRMQLVDHDFYLFVNKEDGAPAVVYLREDGHVGMLIATEDE